MSIKTSEQMRAARAILGMSQAQLAEKAEVSLPTIKRMEAKSGYLQGRASSIRAVDEIFRGEGVSFSDANLSIGVEQITVRYIARGGEVLRRHPAEVVELMRAAASPPRLPFEDEDSSG